MPADQTPAAITKFKHSLRKAIKRLSKAESRAVDEGRFDLVRDLQRDRYRIEAEYVMLDDTDLSEAETVARIRAATAQIKNARTQLVAATDQLRKLSRALDAAADIVAIATRVVRLI